MNSSTQQRFRWALCLGTLFAACAAGCHRDMRDQPRYETLEATDFFSDGSSARPPLAGTVARGAVGGDEATRTGRSDGRLLTRIPLPLTRQLLQRGQQRFDIFCAHCHGRTGTGEGIIARRGFPRPPTYHSSRLRELPAGHFFDVMTNGFGTMPRFGPQISVNDRWAITAYIRALQFSQHATLDDVPPEFRAQLEQERP